MVSILQKLLADPDWWQVALIIAGTVVATAAFLAERRAVRVTQRADVLLHQVGFTPHTNPSILTSDTEVEIVFKNFGPTRAVDVRTEVGLEIVGGTPTIVHRDRSMPVSVVGGGATFTASFGRLGVKYGEADIDRASSGHLPLIFTAVIHYTDVFGVDHTTRCSGRYFGAGGGCFLVENNHEAT